MVRLLFLLPILLQPSVAVISTNLFAHYSEALKIKCEALPYRTAYVERNCYFSIDSDTDSSRTSGKCSGAIGGARLARDVPTAVWTAIFAEKSDYSLDGDFFAGRKKAMCFYENQHGAFSSDKPAPENSPSSSSEEQRITARMHLPFRLPFTEGVQVGQTILFKGVLTAPAKAFVINFQSGTTNTSVTRDAKGNIPFHVSFRVEQGIVVFGSLIRGTWTREIHIKNPLRTGDTVDLRVFVQANTYQVFLNQKELYTYNAHSSVPMSMIDHLYVYGDGHIDYVKLGDNYNPLPRSDELPSLNPSGSVKQGDELLSKRMYLPHLTPFGKKLEVGQTIIIKGGSAADCREYVINFQTGTKNTSVNRDAKGDIPFHISFRLHSGIVIFGTMNRGQWNKGDTLANPLRRDAEVDLRIRILSDRFQIFFNNKQLHVYKARMPLAGIDHLFIYGQGYVNAVRVEDKYIPSSVESSIPHGFPVCGRQSCSAQIQMFSHRQNVPDCKSLVISGSVQAASFSIKLIRKNGDIALHFNPRFDRKNVALNTYKGGKWLEEEVINKVPFERNVRFDIAITNEANAFQIFVNGIHFASHIHRTCSSNINLLDIQGVLDIDVLSK